jgi:hypothetical protein
MRSDRAHKAGGGLKDFDSGLKYSSRQEVGEDRVPGGPRTVRLRAPPGSARGLGSAKSLSIARWWPRHWAHRWNFLFGGFPADLWYQICLAPVSVEAGSPTISEASRKRLPPSSPLSSFPDLKTVLCVGQSVTFSY